tara:strand:- start:2656 stop:2868 length:213 start_codon:yes stop_codon:yes gene_type:complete
MNTHNSNLTPHAIAAAFETPYVAYIKQVHVKGQDAYAIFASDGTELAVVDDRDVAFAAALQHEYLPVSVH